MTMTTDASDVKIVPMTLSTAEVRLSFGGTVVSIGKVSTQNGRWYWQHRDGEQSSPMAATRSEAATQLADYHRAFKPLPAAMPAAPTAPAGAPVRRLLFG